MIGRRTFIYLYNSELNLYIIYILKSLVCVWFCLLCYFIGLVFIVVSLFDFAWFEVVGIGLCWICVVGSV